jgi:hypothetical protein
MEENEDKTIAYRIEISGKVWSKFKKKTGKDMTMNERICRMVYAEVGEPYPESNDNVKQSNKKPSKAKSSKMDK